MRQLAEAAQRNELVAGVTRSGKSYFAWMETAALPFGAIWIESDRSRPPNQLRGRVVRADMGTDLEDILALASKGKIVQYVTHKRLSVARAEVVAICRRLMEREEGEQPEVRLVIDEAHQFIPQKGGTLDDETGEIMRRGLKRGVGVTLIDQRPASIHKDAVTQCEAFTLFPTAFEGPWLQRYGIPPKQIKALLEKAPKHSYVQITNGTPWPPRIWGRGAPMAALVEVS